ncbi:cytohesin-like protein [Cryptosporidium bovis]|uniref:cytohesin-like protein n=1 Tax=Cryptosporidium bovis TaxID=310047 RepID=UPI00351A25CF|nr:cytohesin-like protein [Cryptosporidium bovis]
MGDIEIRKKYVVSRKIQSRKSILSERECNKSESNLSYVDSTDFGGNSILNKNISPSLVLDSSLTSATATSSQNNTPNSSRIGFPLKIISQDDWPRINPCWSETTNSGSNIGVAGRLIPSISVGKIRQFLMASRRNVVGGSFHNDESGNRLNCNGVVRNIYSSSYCTATSSPNSQNNSALSKEISKDLNSNNFHNVTDSCNSAMSTTSGSNNIRATRSVHFDQNCHNISSPYDESYNSLNLRDNPTNINVLSSNSSVSSFSGGNRDKIKTKEKEMDDAARISLSRLFVSQGQFHLDILKEEIHLMEQLEQGVLLFNNSPEEGILYMIEHKLIENDPLYIANFLLHTDFLDKKKVGELLGGHSNFSISILNNYVRLFNTNSLEPDIALRYFLSRFFLPGESQMVYRILERFSVSYVKDNQESDSNKLFSKCTSDHIHTLFYALVMLNTSLHNPHVRNKMSKSEFTSMCILSGIPFSTEQLELMFDRVLENELKPFLSPYEQVYGRLSRDPKVLRSKEVPAVNVSLLQKGSVFRKFHSKKRSHAIIAWISQDSNLFCWKRVRKKDSDAILNPSLLVNNLAPQVEKVVSRNKKYIRDSCRCTCSSSNSSIGANSYSESKTCILTNHTKLSKKLRGAFGLETFDLSCILLEDIVDLNVGITRNESSLFSSANKKAFGITSTNISGRFGSGVRNYNNGSNRNDTTGISGVGTTASSRNNGDGARINVGPNKNNSGIFSSLNKRKAKRRSNFVSITSSRGNKSHYSSIPSSSYHTGGTRSKSLRAQESELESRCFSLFTKKGERIDLCSLDSTHPSILIWVRFFHQIILKNQEKKEEKNDSSKRHTKSTGVVIHDNYFDQDKGIESDLLKIWYHGIFLQWENHWSLNSHIISLPNSRLSKRMSSMGFGGGTGAILGNNIYNNASENVYFNCQSGNIYIYSPKNSHRNDYYGKLSFFGRGNATFEGNDCLYNAQNQYDNTLTEKVLDIKSNSSSVSNTTWIRNNGICKDDKEIRKKLIVLGLGEGNCKPKRKCFKALSHFRNGIVSQFYKKQNIFSKLTNYQAPISHPILHLWSNNIPYSYRGILWNIAIGNQLQINHNTFVDLLKMRKKFLNPKKDTFSPGLRHSNNSPQKYYDSNIHQYGFPSNNDMSEPYSYYYMHAAAPVVGEGGPIREAFMVHLRRFHKDVSNVFPEFHSYFIGAGAVLGCKIWDRSRGFYSVDLMIERDNKREDEERNAREYEVEKTEKDSEIFANINARKSDIECLEKYREEKTENLSTSGERNTTGELVCDEYSDKKDSFCENRSVNESSTGSACFSSKQSPSSSPTLVSPISGEMNADGYNQKQNKKSLKISSNDNYCYYNYYNRCTNLKEVELESEVDSVFLFMNDNQETHKIFESTKILVECFILYRPDIGYVEGMSHIAIILLLFNIDLLEAFITFTNLLHSCYFLDLFLLNHRNVKMRLDFFDSLLKELIPSLHNHFDLLSITSDTYLMTWFTSLFSICLPIQIIPRVWDSIFLFGEPYAFQVAAAILKYHEHKLIMTSFEGCISILHTVPSIFDFRRFNSSLEQFNGIISNRFGQWLAAQRLSEQKADLFEELL